MADQALSIEEWRVIEEAPHYAVSNLGGVKRIVPDHFGRPLRVLRTPLGDAGYPVCSLHVEGGPQLHRKVHVLVCRAFHGLKPTEAHEVRHLDGNRENPCADNLAWGTSSENKQDTVAMGRAVRRPAAPKLTEQDVREIRRRETTTVELARKFGVSRSSISAILNGHRHANVK